MNSLKVFGKVILMKWFLSLILGTVIWFILTFLFGFIIGMIGLSDQNIFKDYSNFFNLFLYPIGVWIGFRITKTPFFSNKEK